MLQLLQGFPPKVDIMFLSQKPILGVFEHLGHIGFFIDCTLVEKNETFYR